MISSPFIIVIICITIALFSKYPLKIGGLLIGCLIYYYIIYNYKSSIHFIKDNYNKLTIRDEHAESDIFPQLTIFIDKYKDNYSTILNNINIAVGYIIECGKDIITANYMHHAYNDLLFLENKLLEDARCDNNYDDIKQFLMQFNKDVLEFINKYINISNINIKTPLTLINNSIDDEMPANINLYDDNIIHF
jgi:hypothetical protein